MDLHIYLHTVGHNEQLDRIENLLQQVLNKESDMSAELDNLKAAVEAENVVIASAETLLQQLSDQIKANANDPVALQALADEVSARSAELATAVAANTPAAAPPVP